MPTTAIKPVNQHDQPILVHEVIDSHDRSSRLYARARQTRDGLIHWELTRTFSGSSNPEMHRVACQLTLPREAIQALRDQLNAILEDPHLDTARPARDWSA